nr:MAG TPA: hypothetical protein [Caudoviricetes sp.]
MLIFDRQTLEALKEKGYAYIAAVTKIVRQYKYYNVQLIDDVIENGCKWIGSIETRIPEKKIDWNKTIRKGDIKC